MFDNNFDNGFAVEKQICHSDFRKCPFVTYFQSKFFLQSSEMEKNPASDSVASNHAHIQLSPKKLAEMHIKSKNDQNQKFIGKADAYEQRTRAVQTELRKNNLLLAQLLQNHSK